MYPEPLKVIGITFIRSYGVMLALSFLLGMLWAWRRAVKARLNPNDIVDLSLVVLIAAIVGSRFFYVIYHLDEFQNDLLDIINPFHSSYVGIAGLSMMGGVFLALIATGIFLWVKRLNPWPVVDVMMPMFALGVGITRIGCFLNGCCYGLPTKSPLGVVFPADSMAGFEFPSTPLIPTQIYESMAGFVILLIVLWSERHKRFDGHSFWITLGLYTAWRFFIDFLRYYEPSMVVAKIAGQDFSRNQLLSAILFVVSVVAYLVMYSRYAGRATADVEPIA